MLGEARQIHVGDVVDRSEVSVGRGGGESGGRREVAQTRRTLRMKIGVGANGIDEPTPAVATVGAARKGTPSEVVERHGYIVCLADELRIDSQLR